MRARVKVRSDRTRVGKERGESENEERGEKREQKKRHKGEETEGEAKGVHSKGRDMRKWRKRGKGRGGMVEGLEGHRGREKYS